MSKKSRTVSNPGWFPKGRSGNPKGRPKGSRVKAGSAFEVLVDKTFTVPDGGGMRDISFEEALQRRTFQEALDGKAMAIREVLKWIRKREAWLAEHNPKAHEPITTLISVIPTTPMKPWCSWALRHQIPHVPRMAPIGPSFFWSRGRFRLRSAAVEAANV